MKPMVNGLATIEPALASCLMLAVLLTLVATRSAADHHAVAPAEVEAVLNYHRINAQLITAGQISPIHAAQLRDAGVDVVINLSVADPERNQDEAFAIAAQGIAYFNIPVVWDVPSDADLDLFLNLMDATKGKHVLVHCFANYRASAFTYLHRVLRGGVDPQVARKDMETVWTEKAWAEYPQWRELLQRAQR